MANNAGELFAIISNYSPLYEDMMDSWGDVFSITGFLKIYLEMFTIIIGILFLKIIFKLKGYIPTIPRKIRIISFSCFAIITCSVTLIAFLFKESSIGAIVIILSLLVWMIINILITFWMALNRDRTDNIKHAEIDDTKTAVNLVTQVTSAGQREPLDTLGYGTEQLERDVAKTDDGGTNFTFDVDSSSDSKAYEKLIKHLRIHCPSGWVLIKDEKIADFHKRYTIRGNREKLAKAATLWR